MKKPRITTQKALRAEFWSTYPHLDRKKINMGPQRVYKTDTRVTFCGFVDRLCRDGSISDALAQRATLES